MRYAERLLMIFSVLLISLNTVDAAILLSLTHGQRVYPFNEIPVARATVFTLSAEDQVTIGAVFDSSLIFYFPAANQARGAHSLSFKDLALNE